MRYFCLMLPGLIMATQASAYPNVCDVVKSAHFNNLLGFKQRMTTCGSPIPRPCVRFHYYVPRYFIEVVSRGGDSFFKRLPGAQWQLRSAKQRQLYEALGQDGAYSFHAHALRVPHSYAGFSGMPCGGPPPDLYCFSAMSEHLGRRWATGSPDLWQPQFQAWSLSPKACLLKGAAESVTGTSVPGGTDVASCSFPAVWLRHYPPSPQPVCSGWGTHFPRSGTVTSSDRTTASLVVASRIKSLAGEVFQGLQSTALDKWQMIYPRSSSGFRHGQNIAALRMNAVNEVGRNPYRKSGYLYTIWQHKTCKKDVPWIQAAQAWLTSLRKACGV